MRSYILLIVSFAAFAYGLPISDVEDKKPVDSKFLSKAGKLLAAIAVEKNVKPNNDGSSLVTKEEVVFSSTGYPTFNAFDQNSDGYIEFDEFAATDGKEHKSNFQRADTNGDQKLSPEEFSRMPFIVTYELEHEFSDTEEDVSPVVFLTPPESISRFNEKETKIKADSGYADGVDVAEISVVPLDESKLEKEEFKDEIIKDYIVRVKDQSNASTEIEKESKESKNAKLPEGSQFTAEDMPVKIDDEDDEEMIEMKDEDIPVEPIDDLSEEERYDLEEMRDINDINEDDKLMNEQINRID